MFDWLRGTATAGLLAVAMLLALLTGSAAALTTYVRGSNYEATALVDAVTAAGGENVSVGNSAERIAANELRVATSASMATAESELAQRVAVEQVAGTSLLAFTGRAETPRAAADAANTRARAYTTFRAEQRSRTLLERADGLALQLRALDNLNTTGVEATALAEQYADLTAQEVGLRTQAAEQSSALLVEAAPPQAPVGPSPLAAATGASLLTLAGLLIVILLVRR